MGLPQQPVALLLPYEAIAAKAECARSTVAEALKALEWAGVLTWQHRITRRFFHRPAQPSPLCEP